MILSQNTTNEYEQIELELDSPVQFPIPQPRLVPRNGAIRFTATPDVIGLEGDK